jgi:hypothetical protein
MTQKHRPDWDFWSQQTLVNVQCAVALSIDIEPVPEKAIRETHSNGYFYTWIPIREHIKEINRESMFERNDLFFDGEQRVALGVTIQEKKRKKLLLITSKEVVDNGEYKRRLQELAMWVKSQRLGRTDSKELTHLKHAYSKIVLLKEFVELCIEQRRSIPKELAKVLDKNKSYGARAKLSRTADRDKRMMVARDRLIAAGHHSVAKQLLKEFGDEFKTLKTLQNVIYKVNKSTK